MSGFCVGLLCMWETAEQGLTIRHGLRGDCVELTTDDAFTAGRRSATGAYVQVCEVTHLSGLNHLYKDSRFSNPKAQEYTLG